MYKEFYGLKEKPFNLTPDPAYFYLSQNHKNAYAHLEYAIAENKGFVVITGEIGSGKTALIKYLLSNVGVDVNVGLINNTRPFSRHMLTLICKEFELSVNGDEAADLQEIFYGFLLDQYARRKRVILIVDEAQNLSQESLEEIRLLSNLESEKNHLLQIILAGQPGLRENLQRKGLEQFTQRVSVTYHLGRLGMKDAIKYIYYRLKKAGAMDFNIFRHEAIKAIYHYSRGIPRVINILCDTALLYGYGEGHKEIGEKLIMAIVSERRKSGIFDGVKETQGAAGFEGMQPGRPARLDADDQIAKLEHTLKHIEGQLLQVNKNMEIMARKDEQVLEIMKIMKDDFKRLIDLTPVCEADDPPEDSKTAKKWSSIFGVSRVR
jgi:general secretion pathway protein A